MSTETIVLAAALLIFLLAVRRPFHFRRIRRGHSWRYHWYIDKNSLLWRFRRWEWYWTRGRRCAWCHKKLSLHRRGMRWRLGASVAQFDHINYEHLCFERYGRDIRMLCGGCHMRRHGHY